VSNSEPISARNGLKESACLGQSLVRIIKAPQLQDIRSSQDMIQEETRKKRSRRIRRWIRKQAHAQNGAGDGQALLPGRPQTYSILECLEFKILKTEMFEF
jgi:hypothetical protein